MLFDLSDRAKLRVSGGDRIRYLNGQVTNDVRKANANLSMAACVISAKGKMDGFVFIAGEEDDLLLDTDPELREALTQRLERYVIADDVTIEDVTDRYALFHVTSEQPPALPNEPLWRRGKRFGIAGWDVFVDATEHDRIWQLLAAKETACDAECADRFRIEQGVPRWGRELTGEIIPVEAHLETDAIDYAKGCYIGQEVISRMKMSGQTNKRLCGLISLDNVALTPGTRILAPGGEKDVGWITSATRSDRLGKEIALGYVKRGFNEPGSQLLGPQAVEVVALPFFSS
ncbi:MAG: YgfZ/GcvT domain-containing protein [Chthoniobacterales bacterium]